VKPAECLLAFLGEQLGQDETAWSVGSFGAIAEFMRDPDEPATFHRDGTTLSVVTARGGLRLNAQVGLRPIASETPTVEAWNHRVALCLPRDLCGMNNRRELTEIGPDAEALRPDERDGVLFDLGLGLLQVDALIRTTDPGVVAALRREVGKPVLAAESDAMHVILHANPHRVFVSRIGRVEVFQPIPPPDGKSPEGPHTHVLPKLLAHGRTHSATEPVPDGWVPCGHCYPPSAIRDYLGRPRRFDAKCHASFQALLEQYGEPERLALKMSLIDSVTAGHEPFPMATDGDRFGRATVRVALRQLQASGTRSSTLAAWLAVYDSAEKGQGIDASLEHPGHDMPIVSADGK